MGQRSEIRTLKPHGFPEPLSFPCIGFHHFLFVFFSISFLREKAMKMCQIITFCAFILQKKEGGWGSREGRLNKGTGFRIKVKVTAVREVSVAWDTSKKASWVRPTYDFRGSRQEAPGFQAVACWVPCWVPWYGGIRGKSWTFLLGS